MTLYKHEMKMNQKSLFLWTLCVGFTCFGCILLYTSLESSVKDMADSFLIWAPCPQLLAWTK